MDIGSKLGAQTMSVSTAGSALPRALLHTPRTAHDATLAQLRAWILDGTLGPDERLHQDRLAAALGVSRMPIREALRQLAAEGLVRIYPHRGAFVASLNPAEIRELYLVRAALERLAAGIAAERIDGEALARLDGLVARMWDAVEVEDDETAIELDRLFHDTIYSAAGMPFLHDLIFQARRRSDVFRRAHAHIPGRSRVSTEEHAEFLAALATRDRDRVERLTCAHLMNAAEHLIAYVAGDRP
jgi:DNA-binding GntR family transcriptional regulator